MVGSRPGQGARPRKWAVRFQRRMDEEERMAGTTTLPLVRGARCELRPAPLRWPKAAVVSPPRNAFFVEASVHGCLYGRNGSLASVKA